MLIKFESKKVAPFIMQSQVAKQLLSMAKLSGETEGSISGAAILEAIANLEKSLSEQAAVEQEAEDGEDEQEFVSLKSRAVPLLEMLLHAQQIDGYVMWRVE